MCMVKVFLTSVAIETSKKDNHMPCTKFNENISDKMQARCFYSMQFFFVIIIVEPSNLVGSIIIIVF